MALFFNGNMLSLETKSFNREKKKSYRTNDGCLFKKGKI